MSQTKVQLVDLNGFEAIIDADADTSITADTDDQIDFKLGGVDEMTMSSSGIVINEGSNDRDFRIESNGKANMFFVDGGNDKIGINTTGSTPSQVTIEDVTGNGGGTLGLTTDTSGTSDNLGRFHFGNATDGSLAAIFGIADGASDAGALTFRTEATGAALEEALRIDSNRKLATNGETAPDVDTGGLTLNQGANDGNILTFKSSDVSHGFTGQFEDDTYGVFKKNSSSAGGLQILGIAEDDPGVNIFGVADATSGTVASNTNAVVHIDARKTTGGSVGTIGSDMLCLFSNDGSAKVIFTGAGNIHADVSTGSGNIGTFDEYEDAHLVRAYDLSHGKGVIDSKFDKFISYNIEKLADLELIGRDDDGTPNGFVNVTGFQKLHNGAIWQQYEKHQRLAEAVYEMAKEALGEDKADAILEKHDIKLLN